MADVIYDIKEEVVFDGMMEKLADMTEQEQQNFAVLLQGFQAGVQVGQRMAEGQQGETA